MPWHIESDNPDCSGFAVVKDDDGEIEGCHDTKDEATAQLAALYANEEHAMDEPTTEIRTSPPADGYRAISWPSEYREEPDRPPRIVGHFARFGVFNEIDSVTEGRFLERVDKGAFRKTFTENRGRIRVLFQHGKDPDVGEKPIAVPNELRSDDVGPYYDAELLDGIHPLVLDGLRKGQYGVSYRFQVTREDWEPAPTKSDYNPKGLPERTIREARVFEFGPVTFPADAGADVAVRSLSDQMRLPVPSKPVAPSADAEASMPHLGPERRDEPVPIAAKEHKVEDPKKWTSLEEMTARVNELDAEIAREAERPGVLPDAEQAAFDDKVAERAALEHSMTAWRNRLSQVRTAAETPGKTERVYEPVASIIRNKRDIYDFSETGFRSVEERNQTWRDDAMRATEVADFAHPLTDKPKTEDRLAWLLDHADSPDKELARRIKATGSPLYRRAFDKIVRGRGTMFLTPEELRGTALAVGVDATGGFAVPFAFDPTIIAIGAWTGAVNPYRRICRVVPIVGTDTWNALTSTVVTATRTTEAAVTIEQGPTFAQPQYVVTRVQGQITLSHEMAQDRPDLSSELAGLIQEAKDNEEENSMAVGATAAANIGVIPVNGTSGAFTSLTTAASVTLAAADADATEAALPVRHRFNAQWVMSRTNIRRFQALETTGGRLFGGVQYPAVGTAATDRGGNTGLRLLGYPVNESPSAPTAGTANIMIATLFNPDQYVIVDRIGTSIKFIPFLFGGAQGNLVTGQEAIYFMWRNTAKPLNVDAGRALRFLT